MNYYSVAFSDGSGYMLKGKDVEYSANYLCVYGKDRQLQDIIPYHNLKVFSFITEGEYIKAMSDGNGLQ